MTQPVVIIDGLSDFWTDIQDAATTTFGHIHRLEGYTNNMRIITPTIERIDRTEPILNALRQSDAHAADLYDDAGVYLRTVRIDMDDETRCANGECNCTTMERDTMEEANNVMIDNTLTAPVPLFEQLLAEEEVVLYAAQLDQIENEPFTISGVRTDRRVHAFDDQFEVVRYDRRGKWYIENRTETGEGRDRRQLSVDDAVTHALGMLESDSGFVRYGIKGGAIFDRRVRAALNT